MVRALERLAEVHAVGADGVDVSAVPPNRLPVLAWYGLAAKARHLRQLTEPRRTDGVTGLLVAPFVGLFGTPQVASGPALKLHTFLALLVYAAVGWLLARPPGC